MSNLKAAPIGVFDSGYGGLTILSEIQKKLPQYDYIYLGDNSRAPYGSRSFDVVYEFTRQAVLSLFDLGCNLVILACNTASAKALRTIQQNDLPKIHPDKRVLGIIRPTAEIIGSVSTTKHIGILGTQGTIDSDSYPLEIHKLYPDIVVNSHACPMWAPLVENFQENNDGADYFVKEDIEELLRMDPLIDSIILGCTHYPLLMESIEKYTPDNITIISQGKYVVDSLEDYLKRHPSMNMICSKNGNTGFYTTECATKFEETASIFLKKKIKSVVRINLE